MSVKRLMKNAWKEYNERDKTDTLYPYRSSLPWYSSLSLTEEKPTTITVSDPASLNETFLTENGIKRH